MIEETPFPFHAKALACLEDSGKLTEVTPLDKEGNTMPRRRHEYCSNVSKTPADADDGKKNWQLLEFEFC